MWSLGFVLRGTMRIVYCAASIQSCTWSNLPLWKCGNFKKMKQRHQVVICQTAASFTLPLLDLPVNYGGLLSPTRIPCPPVTPSSPKNMAMQNRSITTDLCILLYNSLQSLQYTLHFKSSIILNLVFYSQCTLSFHLFHTTETNHG